MGILDNVNPLIPDELMLQLKQVKKPSRQRKTEPWVSTNGYMYTYNEEGKVVLLHRYLMEKKLGRPLQRSEEVKFKDNNRLNCLLDNLYIAGTIDPESIICLHCGKRALKNE